MLLQKGYHQTSAATHSQPSSRTSAGVTSYRMTPEGYHVFPVAIVENEQAVRCKLTGLYELSVNKTDISLHNISKKELVYSWPYRYIRRYGRTSKNFQFEAGRKCESGAGLFSLITENALGEAIFIQVTKRFDEIRHKLTNLTPSSSFDEDSSEDETNTPALPPRNYKQDTLRSLFRRGKKSSALGVSKPVEKRAPEPAARKPRPMQQSCYEEVDVDDEEPTLEQSKSPSYLNNLIQSQRPKYRVKNSVSSSSSSSNESIGHDAIYSVLCDDNANRKSTLTENYSQVDRSAQR